MRRRTHGFTLVEVMVVMVMMAVVTVSVMELFVSTVVLNEEIIRSEEAQAALEQMVEEIQATFQGQYEAYVTDSGEVLHDGPPAHAGNNGNHYGWYIGVGNPHDEAMFDEGGAGGGGSIPSGSLMSFNGIDAVIAKYHRDDDLLLTFHSAPDRSNNQVSTARVIFYLEEDNVPVEFGATPTGGGRGDLDLNGDGSIDSQAWDELDGGRWPILILPCEVRIEWEGLGGTQTESRYLLLSREAGEV